MPKFSKEMARFARELDQNDMLNSWFEQTEEEQLNHAVSAAGRGEDATLSLLKIAAIRSLQASIRQMISADSATEVKKKAVV